MHDTATAQAPATGWVAATRSLWLASALFGTVSNLLVLTGPMFMLLVYDRVLPGRSEPTLMVLFALVLFLYAMMAGIDTARARIMARIGARSRHHLEARVLEASLRARRRDPPDPRAALALHDLDAVQRVLGSNAAQALLDLPFTLLFLVLLFFVHPLLGWLALGGGTVLSALAFLGHLQQREALGTARHAGKAADLLHGAIEAEGGDRVAALSPALVERWQSHRAQALGALLAATDRSVRSTALARAFRLALQSASLGLGAWLVLRGELSPGLMVGTSILLGRALSPVEQLAAHWGALHVALSGWRRLDGFLRASGASPLQTPHRLRGPLVVQGLGVLRPGRPVPLLRLAGFEVAPGRALGVIGPSGSGKSLLARVLAGATAQSSGTLRFAGVALWRVPPERIGYLPQRFGLLPGTIGEAIARHDGEASPARIEAAAVLAGVHDAIRRLPEGYATPVTEEVATLPAGMVQLIGLARALYDEPSLIILDEPTAHLDGAGLAQLNAAIHAAKARGAVVVVTAHRPGAIAECDDLLVLEDGVQTGFGPRETVLRGLMRPARAPVADPAAESAPTAGASAGPAGGGPASGGEAAP